MTINLKLVMIDADYCNYLRQFDNKVPYNFDKKEKRPFVGVLFSVESCLYFAPLSSPKSKHLTMNNNIDFLKIKGGELGAVNFNNMIPVTEKNIRLIDLDNGSLNSFEKKYNILLKNQIFWLNRHFDSLFVKSKKLHDDYISNKLNKNIKNRCCNFKLLEEKCIEYNK